MDQSVLFSSARPQFEILARIFQNAKMPASRAFERVSGDAGPLNVRPDGIFFYERPGQLDWKPRGFFEASSGSRRAITRRRTLAAPRIEAERRE